MHFLPKLKETSRNSTIWTLHCLVIGKLNALIASKVSFFFLSIPCLEIFCNVPSRYNLRLDFFVIDTSLWTNQVVCLVFICSFLDSWFWVMKKQSFARLRNYWQILLSYAYRWLCKIYISSEKFVWY